MRRTEGEAVIFILKCDSCDERVVLDERHVDAETLAIVKPPEAVKGWVTLLCDAKQLNGERRYGMTKHMCPVCVAGKK
jgi:hypothetical protein